MLNYEYFYNKTIKKTVALFGSLFNDIKIARLENGKINGTTRVPLSYAPRERYLARIKSEGLREQVAIKLPRMSFEITDMSFDQTSKLNRVNRTTQVDENNNLVKIWQATPYNLTFSLNIISRGQDEALQIVEQILPHFNPNVTVTAKGMEGPDSRTDIPITLQSITSEDSYEGDFENSRRTIIYTLTFEVKIKLIAPIVRNAKIIKAVDVEYFDFNETDAFLSATRTQIVTEDQASNDQSYIIEYSDSPLPDQITYDNP